MNTNIMDSNMGKTLCLHCFLLICAIFSQGKIMAKNPSNPETIMKFHLEIADSLIRLYNWESAKIYLDSASIYKEKVDDPIVLGSLFSGLGDYYSFKYDDQEAHRNYYKAIKYYEKGGKPILQIPI